jgi:hypothetical protein
MVVIGKKIKGTLPVEESTLSAEVQFPLGGFREYSLLAHNAYYLQSIKFCCDHAIVKGTLLEEQSI